MKNLNFNKIFSTAILTLFTTTLLFSQQTYTNSKEEIDLTKYKTYGWIDNKENIPEKHMIVDGNHIFIFNNMNSNKHVKDAITTQMKARGFSEDNNDPDMLVNFKILEKPTELRTFTMDNGQNYLGFGPKSASSTMVPVKEGTVLVNFIDAKTGSNVWQGFASGAFDVSDMKDVSNLEAKVISIFNEWNFDPFGE